jgi:hypothetical protein
MQMIDPTSSTIIPERILPISVPVSKTNQADANGGLSDSVTTSKAQQLQTKLSNLPALRPDAIKQGLLLLADPNYPTSLMLAEIAGRILNSPDATQGLA